MAEFSGGEEKIIRENEPIVFENKTNSSFDVDMGVVFRKSGIYDVSIVGRRTIISKVTERKNDSVGCSGCIYDWFGNPVCSRCARSFRDYYEADIKGEQDE